MRNQITEKTGSTHSHKNTIKHHNYMFYSVGKRWVVTLIVIKEF